MGRLFRSSSLRLLVFSCFLLTGKPFAGNGVRNWNQGTHCSSFPGLSHVRPDSTECSFLLISKFPSSVLRLFPWAPTVSGGLKRTSSAEHFPINMFTCLFFLPDTKVYAALGNHDFHPKNQFPAGSNNIYNQVAELWRPWLSNESIALFKEGTFCNYKHFLVCPGLTEFCPHQDPRKRVPILSPLHR